MKGWWWGKCNKSTQEFHRMLCFTCLHTVTKKKKKKKKKIIKLKDSLLPKLEWLSWDNLLSLLFTLVTYMKFFYNKIWPEIWGKRIQIWFFFGGRGGGGGGGWKNVSNGTSTGTSPPQGQQLCQIILKSIHKCRSYGPDKSRQTYTGMHIHLSKIVTIYLSKIVTNKAMSRFTANEFDKKENILPLHAAGVTEAQLWRWCMYLYSSNIFLTLKTKVSKITDLSLYSLIRMFQWVNNQILVVHHKWSINCHKS